MSLKIVCNETIKGVKIVSIVGFQPWPVELGINFFLYNELHLVVNMFSNPFRTGQYIG
jgi:hypothetical protein